MNCCSFSHEAKHEQDSEKRRERDVWPKLVNILDLKVKDEEKTSGEERD